VKSADKERLCVTEIIGNKLLVNSSFPQTERFVLKLFAARAFAIQGVCQLCCRSKNFRDGLPRTRTSRADPDARLCGALETISRYWSVDIYCLACKETNLMHRLSSAYSVTIPLHVSGLLLAHHQEVTVCILTYSVEQSPSWEANRFATGQETPCVLLNPKVHYRIYNCLPPASILSQPNPVHTPTSHFLKIHPNIILPSTPGSLQSSLSLSFPHQNPIHAFYPVRATCPAPLILYFITRTILGEEYRAWITSLWSFLHSIVTSLS
jgi:hypothetical protein